jgi:hypothetical protein
MLGAIATGYTEEVRRAVWNIPVDVMRLAKTALRCKIAPFSFNHAKLG